MRCLSYYNNPLHVFNPNTKERNGLLTYYKTYGITTLNKHVNGNHVVIVKFFEEVMVYENELLKDNQQRKGLMCQTM
jgi:hypothetical protein